MSRVLFVIPTLGTRNEWLQESIRSVVGQPLAGLDVVVVGPSGCPAEPLAVDLGAHFLTCDRPGLSAAINDAWRRCGDGADYFAWLGDDDVLAPLSLVTAVDHLDRHPGCAAVYGRLRVIRADGSTLFTDRPGRLAARLLPYGTDQVPQPGSLFRAAAVRQTGLLDETLGYSMDYDLLLRLRRVGSLDYLPVELAAVRTHGERISENRTDSGTEERRVRERNMAPRRLRLYRRLTGPARLVDQAYVSVLRRMPGGPVPAPGGAPYVAVPSADGVAAGTVGST